MLALLLIFICLLVPPLCVLLDASVWRYRYGQWPQWLQCGWTLCNGAADLQRAGDTHSDADTCRFWPASLRN